MKKYKLVLMKRQLFLIFFILVLPGVTSLGIASTYLQDNTLKLKPGESYVYKITLQNGDNVDITTEFSLNGEIAQIINPKEKYELGAKTYDTTIPLNITIPENDIPGKVYLISYSLRPISDSKGQISMNFKLNKNFKVEVIEEENTKIQPSVEKPSKGFAFLPLVISGVILLLSFTLVLLLKRSSILATKLVKTPQKVPKNMKKSLVKIVKRKETSEMSPRDIKRLKQNIEKKEDKLSQHEKEQEKIQKELEKMREELSKKQEALKRKEKSIKEKEAELQKTLKKSLETLEKEQKEEYGELMEVKDKLENKEEKLSKKEEQLNKKEIQLLQLKQNIAIVQKAIEDDKFKHEEKEKQLLEKEEKIQEKKEDLQEELESRIKEPERIPKRKEIHIASPDNYFHLSSGESLKTISELKLALISMDTETYNHHVNENRNDFANWLKHTFKNELLGNKILLSRSRGETIMILENEGY